MNIYQENSAINRMLQSHGLPTLESGSGLMAALGFLVEDHEHLGSMLVRCEPENRSAMYDSLKPYLRFQAKPLHTYIAERAERAERQDLPTIDADGKINFSPSITPTIDQEVAAISQELPPDQRGFVSIAQKAFAEQTAHWHLTVTCRKCTKTETFSGFRKADAVQAARDEGWRYDSFGEGRNVCPQCP